MPIRYLATHQLCVVCSEGHEHLSVATVHR